VVDSKNCVKRIVEKKCVGAKGWVLEVYVIAGDYGENVCKGDQDKGGGEEAWA
jgi:hypothetical protein